jgi:hypothetical protein
MTEYYLADRRAEERAQTRQRSKADQAPTESQNVKVTLLGDFLFASGEPKGCDPYNSTQGKTSRETFRNWRTRR